MKDAHGDEEPGLVSTKVMDVVVALLFLAISGLVIHDSNRLGFTWQEGVGPAAGFFPFYIALIMGAASLAVLAAAVRNKSVPRRSFVSTTASKRVLALLIPLIVYVALIAFAGMYVASALFIALFMIFFGRYGFLVAVPTGAGIATVLFLLFERWFLMPMPVGPLEKALLGY